VSATIGLDDPTVFNRTSVLNLGVAATPAGFSKPQLALSKPLPLAPILTAAPMLLTSPATSASTRLGVCSRLVLSGIS
jgi:hypothetical protein